MTDLDELERKARAMQLAIIGKGGVGTARTIREYDEMTADPVVILALIERVRAAEAIVAVVRHEYRTAPNEQGMLIAHSPYYDLMGALLDLQTQNADAICIRTVDRVTQALARIEDALEVKP